VRTLLFAALLLNFACEPQTGYPIPATVHAELSSAGNEVSIRNLDSFAWNHVSVAVTVSSGGESYRAERAVVPAGALLRIGALEFHNAAGASLDLTYNKIRSIAVTTDRGSVLKTM
jgi:hypothetical protein